MNIFDPVSSDVSSGYAVSQQHHPKQYEYVLIRKTDGTITVGYWLDSLEGYVEAVDPFEEWIEDAELWARFPMNFGGGLWSEP